MNESELKLEQAVRAIERAERELIAEHGPGHLFVVLAGYAKAHALTDNVDGAIYAIDTIGTWGIEALEEAQLLLRSLLDLKTQEIRRQGKKARERALADPRFGTFGPFYHRHVHTTDERQEAQVKVPPRLHRPGKEESVTAITIPWPNSEQLREFLREREIDLDEIDLPSQRSVHTGVIAPGDSPLG